MQCSAKPVADHLHLALSIDLRLIPGFILKAA